MCNEKTLVTQEHLDVRAPRYRLQNKQTNEINKQHTQQQQEKNGLHNRSVK